MAPRRKQKIDYTLKFNNMQSIYNADGNIDYSIFGDSYNLDKINEAILNARQKGWGSVNIGNREYTLYQKLNDKIVSNKPILEFNPEEKYTEDQLAVYNWINRKNPEALAATRNYAVGYSPVTKEKEVEKAKLPDDATPAITNSLENKYDKLPLGISIMPTRGRNSLLRTQYELLFGNNSEDYLNSNSMSGYINKYYGHEWDMPTIKNELQLTAHFVSNNGNLATARRGKGEDYLVMESSRLNRDLGGYKGLNYRNLINFLTPEKFEQYGVNGRYNNYLDFYERLFNLSASRNGMQGGELDDLFGKDYKQVLNNIAHELGIEGYLQGGIIKMLFI